MPARSCSRDRVPARMRPPAPCSPTWCARRTTHRRWPVRCWPVWRSSRRRRWRRWASRPRILQPYDGRGHVSVSLTFDEVKQRARRAPMVPIFRDMLSDALTPVTAYAALASDGPAYLLESVERGEHLGRYSFVAADPMAIVTISGGVATVQDANGRHELEGADPLRALEAYLKMFAAEPADQPAAVSRLGNVSQPDFFKAVEEARAHILAGDIYQVQLAQRFTVPLQAEPFDVYRLLRALNPSPYMYFLKLPSVTILGTSPEILVTVQGRQLRYRPIAGTRRRGRDDAADRRMEEELRSSEKERAEHVMLVDLGRNDLGRVCEIGSVKVTELMTVERYSHVMHLVSNIVGTLRPDCTPMDALRACFPAGTVTRAPKIRAMEIIAELEGERRGAYAGAIE